MTSLFSTDQVEVSCIADTIKLQDVKAHFAKSYVATQYRDALHIDVPRGHIFVFNYGVVVTWGISDAKKSLIMEGLEKFYSKEQNKDWEIYRFALQPEARFSFSNNTVTLQNSKIHTLLAVSHALAQSCKLQIFECRAQKSLDDNRYLTDELINKGRISLSRTQLAKLRGALFQTKSDIMSRFSLLDTPEYFGDFPETQELYIGASRYQELDQRIELLKLKLQTIHELLDMLVAEQNHKHSSFLEWIIIILIALEIVLFFVN
ncbi:RMD1 family protein [Aliiglaciecola litoralis]|uniref:RMD1 family protein n=1 Tax=Aliiglaciecola litoralis TaxID=582857 RepID=A0ABN1LEN1_9ALTE